MLTRFESRGFRNLESTGLEFEAGGHLLLGDNGAGKTSFLEGVYMLATTRSFRTPRINDCLRHGEGSFFLSGETDDRAQLEVAWVDGERIRRTRGARVPLADHLAVLPVVSWTQADLEVLVGPPQARRKFIDRGVISCRPAAISVVSRYRQALQEKRRLLQKARPSDKGLVDLLDPWNRLVAEASAQLAKLRFSYVESLQQELHEVIGLCELDLPPISLRYRPSPKEALEGQNIIYDKLESAFSREVALQQPVMGCHRDELEIRWQGHPIRQVASAGERKALGLALTAAHGRVLEASSVRPVYLLDDVDTELDAGRLASLWEFFGATKQVFATSNRPVVWRDLAVPNRFRCNTGAIRRGA